jgi:hypothetical protein
VGWVAAFAAWLIEKFGQAVLSWTVGELLRRLEASGDEPPEAAHGQSCECTHCVRDGEDFDSDELGIDPEGEGWHSWQTGS